MVQFDTNIYDHVVFNFAAYATKSSDQLYELTNSGKKNDFTHSPPVEETIDFDQDNEDMMIKGMNPLSNLDTDNEVVAE